MNKKLKNALLFIMFQVFGLFSAVFCTALLYLSIDSSTLTIAKDLLLQLRMENIFLAVLIAQELLFMRVEFKDWKSELPGA